MLEKCHDSKNKEQNKDYDTEKEKSNELMLPDLLFL